MVLYSNDKGENNMKIYMDELPKNCGECPFNYDSVGCNIFEPETEEEHKELGKCLNSMYSSMKDAITDRRFSKCPLMEYVQDIGIKKL